MMCHSPVKSN
ncbi:hypothetical protein AOLI_G00012980 [Acnodon oligacanthus]